MFKTAVALVGGNAISYQLSALLKTRTLYAYQEQPGSYKKYIDILADEDSRYAALTIKNMWLLS